MLDFLLYSIKSGLCLAIFYGFYKLVLAKETHVKRNRFFLLFAVLFSILLPLISFSFEHEQMAKASQFVWEFENSIEEQFIVENTNSTKPLILDLNFWLILFYTLGICLVLGRLINNLISIFKIIKANEVIRHGDLNLVCLKEVQSPYSFFNYVFLNPSILSKTQNKQILLHESIHSKQLHSIDLLIIELVKSIFWFNPIIYLFKRDLLEVHEYCADRACVKKEQNKIDYQQCLLQHVESKMNLNLTSAFNSSLTLKRIKMIKKSNTSVLAHLKLIFIIPVLIISMLSFDYTELKPNNSEAEVLVTESNYMVPIKPSAEVRVTSTYGKRMHPIKKKMLFHKGIDIAAPKGTPIYAIADGLVKKRQDKHVEGKAYGRFLIIEHEKGVASLYSQMNSYAVKLGEKVNRGDIIGYVGTSGISTGPHLHFEIKKNGKNIDPAELIDFSRL